MAGILDDIMSKVGAATQGLPGGGGDQMQMIQQLFSKLPGMANGIQPGMNPQQLIQQLMGGMNLSGLQQGLGQGMMGQPPQPGMGGPVMGMGQRWHPQGWSPFQKNYTGGPSMSQPANPFGGGQGGVAGGVNRWLNPGR